MGALASFTLGQALLTIWTQCEGGFVLGLDEVVELGWADEIFSMCRILWNLGGIDGVDWNGAFPLLSVELKLILQVTITFNDNAAFQLAFMLLTLLVSTFVVVTWTVASLFLGGFLA